jgi:hypothetical protein
MRFATIPEGEPTERPTTATSDRTRLLVDGFELTEAETISERYPRQSLLFGAFIEDLFCHRQRREGVGPPNIKSQMRDDLCRLSLREPVIHGRG